MNGFKLWLAMAGLLIVAGIILPYMVLGGSGAPGLSLAVFWLGFAAAVIVLIAAGVARWRN